MQDIKVDVLKDVVVMYHSHCADGMSSAWIARKVFGEDASYLPASYTSPSPLESVKGGVEGKTIYLLDFSFSYDYMKQLAKDCETLIILDHHESAKKALMPLLSSGEVEGVFDMERSGAMITWDYFFPDESAPIMIEYMQDRDLWNKKLDMTEEVAQYIFATPYTFKDWDSLMSTDIDTIKAEGAVLYRKYIKDINEFIDGGNVKLMSVRGHNLVPVVNIDYTKGSDMCHILCKKVKSPLAVYYHHTEHGVKFGMRSLPNGADVSELAEYYGGGGHVNASGFYISDENFAEFNRNVETYLA